MRDVWPPESAPGATLGWLSGLGMFHKQWANCLLTHLATFHAPSAAGRVIVWLPARQNNSANECRTLWRDALHRLDQGVLYCHNVTQFHGTQGNGISLVRMEKVRRSTCRFSWNSHTLSSNTCRYVITNFTPIGKLMWKVRIEIYLAHKLRL